MCNTKQPVDGNTSELKKRRDINHLAVKDTLKYKKAEATEFSELRCNFLKNCCCATEVLKETLHPTGIGACWRTIATVIEQVRRRELYFHVYHETGEWGPNEAKETALYAFWVLKLHPFYYIGQDSVVVNNVLNAKMAMAFFVRGLDFYAKEKTQNNNDGKHFKLTLSERTAQDLIRSFIFRDISKEALMDIAESLIVEVIPLPT